MITIFTTPKPFSGHIDLIQRNAIASWLALGPEVEVLLVGDEPGMAQVAEEYGVRHLPQIERNEHGTPLVNSVFAVAREAATGDLMCYVNADILLLDDFLPAVQRVAERFERFLVVGQRWDLEVKESLSFGPGAAQALRLRAQREGRLHPPAGSDYFVFRRGAFANMPPFAMGRAGWDNWMIFAGRRARLPVVDATQAITAIHQNHDYGHLPGGRPHYRLPESRQNVALAGGRETVFTLEDTTWQLSAENLQRKPSFSGSIMRKVERSLIASMGPGRTARLVRMAFHPIETFAYYRRAAWRRIRTWLTPGAR